MGVPSFWVGHLTLIPHKIFKLLQPWILLLDQAGAIAFPADLPTDRADTLTVRGAERLEREGQVELLEDDLAEVDLVIMVKDPADIVLLQLFFHQIDLFGDVDKVERRIDGKLKGAEASAADETQPGSHLSLDPDLIADFPDEDIGMGRRKKDGVFLDQVDIEELEVLGDGEPFFRDLVDINNHLSLGSKFNLLYHLTSDCQLNLARQSRPAFGPERLLF